MSDSNTCWCCQASGVDCHCRIVSAEATHPDGRKQQKPFCLMHGRILMWGVDTTWDEDDIIKELVYVPACGPAWNVQLGKRVQR